MGTSVKQARSGSKVPIGASRAYKHKSPIDKAKGYEVIWQNVAPLFEAARPWGNMAFVYFIGEVDNGPIKIGHSKDPISRLRSMQTGNPRRLRIEFVLAGEMHLEKMLHEMWSKYAIYSTRASGKPDTLPGTEWFTAEARPLLEPILATAVENQAQMLNALDPKMSFDDMVSAVRQAHGAHDFTAYPRDEIRYLGAGAGTYIQHRSRL